MRACVRLRVRAWAPQGDAKAQFRVRGRGLIYSSVSRIDVRLRVRARSSGRRQGAVCGGGLLRDGPGPGARTHAHTRFLLLCRATLLCRRRPLCYIYIDIIYICKQGVARDKGRAFSLYSAAAAAGNVKVAARARTHTHTSAVHTHTHTLLRP